MTGKPISLPLEDRWPRISLLRTELCERLVITSSILRHNASWLETLPPACQLNAYDASLFVDLAEQILSKTESSPVSQQVDAGIPVWPLRTSSFCCGANAYDKFPSPESICRFWWCFLRPNAATSRLSRRPLLESVVVDLISIPGPGIKPKCRLCVRGHNGGGVASFIARRDASPSMR